MNIAIYQGETSHESLETFREILYGVDLKYLASDLASFGLENSEEMEKAVVRAIKACRAVRIPIRKNFKEIYVSQRGRVYRDWRLSALGRKLVLINANPSNPVVARLQVELVGRL